MIEICLKENEGGVEKEVLKLPTSMNEISNAWLNDITKAVIPADNYSLIALVSYEKLAMLVGAAKRKQEVSTGVLPLFVKAGHHENGFVDSIEIGTPIVTVSSVLSRAIHVNIKQNVLSATFVVNKIAGNPKVSQNLFGEYSKPVALVDFKLIPNCDIYGVYPNVKLDDAINNNYYLYTTKGQ